MNKTVRFIFVAIAMLSIRSAGQVDAAIPVYAPARQVTGALHSWGSPQMSDLMKLWESGFRKFQPGIAFDDKLKGTASAVAGVYAERADIALLGREIWPSEIQAFTSIYGYGPTTVEVATGSFDVPKATYALMLFVHKENPLSHLSLGQARSIFGNEDRAPESGVRVWGDVGLGGDWADKPIHRYGFNLDNDKALAFRRMVLNNSIRWNGEMQEFSDSGSDAGQLILDALAKDRYGIAISNVHYATPLTKVLALGVHDEGPFIVPTKQNVQSRLYPLVRSVYLVVNRSPGKPLEPKILEFLRYVLGQEGQRDVETEGNYLPLPGELVRSERSKLGIQ